MQQDSLPKVATYATNVGMTKVSEIAMYRERNGRMSLEAFGQLFSPPVDKSTVLRWQRGNITPRRAIEVARVTGIARHLLLPEFFAVSEAAE